MTGGERIRAALVTGSPYPTSAGDKCRQDAADQKDVEPFIIFRRVKVQRTRGLDNTLLAMCETFQVECWGMTRGASDDLEAQAIAALEAVGLLAEDNEPDGLDPEVVVKAAVFVVCVWATPEILSITTDQD